MLLVSVRHESSEVLQLVEPNMWMTIDSHGTKLFWQVMSMALKNLAIAQHCDTIRYAII